MMFKNRKVGAKTVVEVQAKDLDSILATDFKNHLIETLDSVPESITVVDLSKVRFLDSTCLGAMFAAFRQTGSRHKVVLAAPQDAVKYVFDMARVARVMPVFASLDDALALTPENWPIGP
jgi:anti-sigma B factor antagonist